MVLNIFTTNLLVDTVQLMLQLLMLRKDLKELLYHMYFSFVVVSASCFGLCWVNEQSKSLCVILLVGDGQENNCSEEPVSRLQIGLYNYYHQSSAERARRIKG